MYKHIYIYIYIYSHVNMFSQIRQGIKFSFLTILQFTLDRPFLDTFLVRPLPFADIICRYHCRYSPLFAAIIAAIIAATCRYHCYILFAAIIAAICCYYLPLSAVVFCRYHLALSFAAICRYLPLSVAIRRYLGQI